MEDPDTSKNIRTSFVTNSLVAKFTRCSKINILIFCLAIIFGGLVYSGTISKNQFKRNSLFNLGKEEKKPTLAHENLEEIEITPPLEVIHDQLKGQFEDRGEQLEQCYKKLENSEIESKECSEKLKSCSEFGSLSMSFEKDLNVCRKEVESKEEEVLKMRKKMKKMKKKGGVSKEEEGSDSGEKIFVSIASYRDINCSVTVGDLFEKASNPSRIFVGIVQQSDPLTEPDCFRTYCLEAGNKCRKNQVRNTRVHYIQSYGVTAMRYIATQLMEDEDYFLQVDAHTVFEPGWDDSVIDQLKKGQEEVGHEKVVLSQHPPAAEDKTSGTKWISFTCDYFWEDAGGRLYLPRFRSALQRRREFMPAPFRSPFIGAGFIFSPSSMLIEVPYDPYLFYLFSGEEYILSARLWTSGWEIMNPSVKIVSHKYSRNIAKWNFMTNAPSGYQKAAVARVLAIVGQGSWDDVKVDQYTFEKEHYGLGNQRSIDDYHKYAEINWDEEKKKKDDNKWSPVCQRYNELASMVANKLGISDN